MRSLLSFCVVLGAVTLALGQQARDRQTMAGKLTSVNKTTIQIKNFDNQTQDFQVSSTLQVNGDDGKNIRLTDLQDGSTVAVTYTREGEKNMASAIHTAHSSQGKVKSVADNKLQMTDSSNKTQTYSLNQQPRIIIGKNSGEARDLKEGESITVYYYNAKSETPTAAEIRSSR